MSGFWEASKFKKLQKRWYDKLAASGFNDIEEHPQTIHDETANFNDREAVEAYFRLASQYLYSTDFKSLLDKAIWFLYTEGYSLRGIAKGLELSRPRVTRIVEQHSRLMRKQ